MSANDNSAPLPVMRRQAPELRVADTPSKVGPADLVLSEIERSPGDRMEMAEVYAPYRDACRVQGLTALPPETVAEPLRDLCRDASIRWSRDPRGTVHLVGVKRKAPAARLGAPAARVS